MATQLDAVAQLASILGGTKTTSNAGNTAGLESVLAQLQAQNAGGYQELLKSIFQQAAGAIPGYQNAYANSVGARGSSRNSAMEIALSKLLQQTTLAGQQQIATQQNQNLQTQTQAAGAIANATKGTTQQQGTNLGSAAKNLALIAALDKLKLGDKFDSLKDLFGGSSEPASMSAPNLFAQDAARYEAGVYSAPQQLYAPAAADTSNDYVNLFADQIPQTDAGNGDYTNLFAGQAPDEVIPYQMTDADWADLGMDFADGGLVPNFADGGSVTQYAAGGRRSSAPTYKTTAPKTSTVDNTLPREQLTTSIVAPAPTASEVLGGISLTDTLSDTLNKRRDGNVSFNENMSPQDAARNRSIMGVVGDVSTLAGITGNTSIPSMGFFGGLANARDDESALKVAGTTALNIAAPGLGSAASIAMNPTAQNVTNSLAALNPVTLALNIGMKAFDTSIGEQVWGGPQRVDPKTGEVKREAVQGLWGPEVTSVNPVAGWNPMSVTDLGMLGGGDTGADSGGSYGGGSASNVGASRGYGDGSGQNSRQGLADGGEISGNGTGLEDNKQINVSGGEFVISKDVVDAIGVDFFEALQQALHTPAAVQRMRT